MLSITCLCVRVHICMYVYIHVYTAHSHIHIYLNAEYKDISKLSMNYIFLLIIFFFFIPVSAHVWRYDGFLLFFFFVCVYFCNLRNLCVSWDKLRWWQSYNMPEIPRLLSPMFNFYPWVDPVPTRRCHF